MGTPLVILVAISLLEAKVLVATEVSSVQIKTGWMKNAYVDFSVIEILFRKNDLITDFNGSELSDCMSMSGRLGCDYTCSIPLQFWY